jgi:hypothetical protein
LPIREGRSHSSCLINIIGTFATQHFENPTPLNLNQIDRRQPTQANTHHITAMLFSRASLLFALSAAVAAVPHEKNEKNWFGSTAWAPVNKAQQHWGRQNIAGQCNLAAVQLPQGKLKPTPSTSHTNN